MRGLKSRDGRRLLLKLGRQIDRMMVGQRGVHLRMGGSPNIRRLEIQLDKYTHPILITGR